MLKLCGSADQEPEAKLALARWEELQQVSDRDRRERRFRRRAFERARDRALQALAMRLRPWMLSRNQAFRARRSAARGRLTRGAR